VLEYVDLLSGVMMGPKGASSIKVPSAWWHSSRSGGLLLLLFLFAMNFFHVCQKKFLN